MRKSFIVNLLMLCGASLSEAAPFAFNCPRREGKIGVVLAVGKTPLLSSPAEGLWSVAVGWKDGWPDGWHHASPERMVRTGPWTLLEGRLKLPEGVWELRDAYRREGDLLRCTRRFTWRGEKPLARCTLSVRFLIPSLTRGVLLPGILYYGNPSGEKSGRVPVFHGRPDEMSLFEEHRYPMPLVSCEWGDGASRWGAALHALPSPVPHGAVRDQWWSMGVVAEKDGTAVTLLSGPCASNGERSVIKAVQPGFVSYPAAFLNVPPGAVIEKTFYLQVFPVAAEGAGFVDPVRQSIALFAPDDLGGLPAFREIIEAKFRFAKTRWHEAGPVAGFRKYPDRPFLVMGWCGQAASPGYALQVLAEELDDPRCSEMARKSLDFLCSAAFYDGGFHTWYDISKKAWSRHEPLSQGQAMLNFARAIRAARRRGDVTTRWDAFLKKACDFHAKRIMAPQWRPRSTDQAFFIAPLCLASGFYDNDLYRQAALKAGRVYRERHMSMREPYWGGTLDARCEDKEGAYAAFQGFLALYRLTREQGNLEAAQHALHVLLSYVVVWDIDLPPGRLRDHLFKTRGWTVVSPQNQHIDAYGVLMAPDIYEFGQLTRNRTLQDLAVVMYRACGQLIDPFGSHGEQPQHTNYAQRGEVEDLFTLRGGYQEHWTVFWLTAHFLHAAARFKELGVAVDG